jgi:alpha-galactosidase
MPGTITLESPTLRREVIHERGVGTYTSSLVYRPTETDYLAQARAEGIRTPEFDLRINGRRITSLSPECDTPRLSMPAIKRDGIHNTWTHLLRKAAVGIRLYYTLDALYPIMHKRLSVRNLGTQPITLSHVCVEDLPLRDGDTCDWQFYAHYGTQPRELLYTGRVDDPLVRLRNAKTGAAILALNGAPGQAKRTESGAWFWDGQLRWMYDTDLFPFEWTLAPGEGWTSNPMSVAFAQEDTEHDPRWVMPSWMGTSSPAIGMATEPPPCQYNTWDPFGIGIDAATARDLIPIAGRMGFDVFTIDDGWQAQYGENAVSEARFPGGLDAIREQVEAAGMRLGLWASLAAVAPEIAAQHPEWMCRDAQGQPKTTMTAQGEQIVMCLASPFVESAAQRLMDLVGRYNLRYLKLDLTAMFNAYGEPPGCHAEGHAHASAAESIPRIYAAIARVCRCVHAAHPNVLIDLTFELWGQKHSVDYALLRAADQSWISNVGDNRDVSAGARQARLLLYQRALAIPADTMLIGNLRIDTGDPREKLATAFGSAPLLLGDLRKLSDEQIALSATYTTWYKRLRAEVPLCEGFFVLGSPMPDVRAWDGFARLSRAGEGMIILFRNESEAPHAHIRLPIIGDAIYRLSRLNAQGVLHEDVKVSAAQFRAGVDVAFGDEDVVVWEVRKNDHG